MNTALAVDYYASPSGSGTSCTIGSPCSLQTILNDTAKCNANTFWLRGGTYSGKFISTLDSCTVRSYTGEWAVIDGSATTTLTNTINTSDTVLTVGSTAGLESAENIAIDTELMNIQSVDSSTQITVTRNWAPNIGGSASHTAGATVRHAGQTLQVNGSGTTYRNFEITNSYTQRDLEPGAISGEGCCGYYSAVRGAGIALTGDDNNFINLIVHDHLDGIFASSATSNSLFYGILSYNNGAHYYDSGGGREQGSGNGFYLENSAGYSRVYRTISINNFNQNGQFYGVSAAYVGGDHQKSAFANAGSPMGSLIDPSVRNVNVLYGPDAVQSTTASLTDNYYWAPTNAIGGTSALLGYGAGIDTATITGNIFAGGPNTLEIGVVDTITFTGNTVFGGASASAYVVLNAATPAGTWNNNSYPDAQGRSVYDGTSFATWKTNTGFDAASTESTSDMADTVGVIPNEYDTGCNLIIMAPSSPSSINVNLSTCGMSNGQGYAIRNAFDYFDTEVATGTYSSGAPTVSVPLNGAALNVAEPIGHGYAPATTCPAFCALVVVPSQITAYSGSASGSTKITGGARLN